MNIKMNIYKVYRVDRVEWDEYESAVVVAENKKQARELCPFNASNTKKVKVEIVDNKVAGLVIASYKS